MLCSECQPRPNIGSLCPLCGASPSHCECKPPKIRRQSVSPVNHAKVFPPASFWVSSLAASLPTNRTAAQMYDHLYDDPSLEGRLLPSVHGELEGVPGMVHQVFFWTHDYPESESGIGRSVMNLGEVCACPCPSKLVRPRIAHTNGRPEG